MSRYGEDHDDGAVELPEPGSAHGPGERAVATAVRRALTDDPAAPVWTAQRLHVLAEAADRRASQRRRRRLAATPAVLLAGAAAATAVVVAVPLVLGPGGPRTGLPAGQDPAVRWRGATLAGLTPADVQTVLPLAQPLGPGPSAAPTDPVDACGTADLPGVSAPLGTESAEWGTSSTRQVDDDRGGGTETTMHVLLEATVDTYADAAQAQVAADALGRSVRTCTPRSGEQAPVYPFTKEVYIAPALYVSSYEGGVAEVTAVMVNGTAAATVHAWVPVAEAQAPPTGSDQSVDPVPGTDQASLDSAVMSVVRLAGTAAQRAAGS